MKALLFLYCGAVASTLISGQTLEVSNSSISNRTIADVIIRKDNLKTLEAVLSATGLLSSLATPGLNATLFAPSDKAFARLPAGQLDMLMKNATLMEQVLFCKCVVSCLLSVAGAHLGHRHDAMRLECMCCACCSDSRAHLPLFSRPHGALENVSLERHRSRYLVSIQGGDLSLSGYVLQQGSAL